MSQSEHNPGDILASDAEREQTGKLLQEAAVEGRLTMEEFAQRMELAQQARTRSQLQTTLANLPTALDLARTYPAQPAVPGRAADSITTILSSADRTGRWQLAESTKVLTLLGETKLDLRGAVITSPVVTIDVSLFMGSMHIMVPEGMPVEVDVSVILGEKKEQLSRRTPTPGMPLLRVVGSVFMSSLHVRDTPTFSEQLRDRFTELLGGS